MKKIFSIIMLILTVVIVTPVAESRAATRSIWVEGGATIKGAPSAAVGIRYGMFGLKAGGVLNADYLKDEGGKDALVYSRERWTHFQNYPSVTLDGDSSVSKAVGLDVMMFYDFTKKLSGYAEAGLYRHERTKEVYTHNEAETIRVVDWGGGFLAPPGKPIVDSRRVYKKETLEGGAGIHYQVSDFVLLTLGYHTMRGFSGGIGISF